MTRKRQIVFGLGTGRCGTKSLAFLLDSQSGADVTHERNQHGVAWKGGELAVDEALAWCRGADGHTVVGDVGFYYLPYVEYILEREPDAKFVCLQRDCGETVRSYLSNTEGRNHWMHHDGSEWQPDRWDQCYPKYDVAAKREALERYWHEYYDTANELARQYDGALRVFPITTLSTEQGQREILDFVGVPAAGQQTQSDLVMNRSAFVRPPTPSGSTRAISTAVARTLLKQVTAVIKTIDRPQCLDRLIRSIKRDYPGLEILVGDDGFNPCPRDDVGYVRLDTDVGLSRGRNVLLEKVATPYFLLLDDDNEFFRDTRIERLVEVVASSDVSLAAGAVIRCRWKRHRHFRLRPIREQATPFNGLIRHESDRLTLTPGYS
ncbi:MAG TPA: glycosyltransferase, partial [Planctomycetota bacterium]|nr:glycosyltransferase [Planctomycetota bacterium]